MDHTDSLEAAVKDIKLLGPSTSRKSTYYAVLASEEVHKAGASKSSKVGKLCYRCGDVDHVPPNCPFLKATCLGCGLGGHIKKACFRTTKSKKKSEVSQHIVSHVDEQLEETTDYLLLW